MSWLSKALGKTNPLAAISPIFAATSGLLGKKGGGFTPTPTTLYDPFTQEQAKKLYEQTQSGYEQQQAFVNALAQQNALANQANVFKQLQDVASGVGPNPALAALQQATGQNIAGQAALMGGQRGVSRNVGLLARQAGQQGGAIQQQAAGQGATLQAQQQLAALGQLGGLANQQVAQQQTGLAGLNQFGLQGQQNIQDAIARQNAARITQQNALNQINADIAAQKAKQQSGILGNVLGAVGTIGGALLGGPAGAAVGSSLGNMAGGSLNAATAPAPSFGSYNFGQYSFAKGGEVKKPNYALGGMTANQPQSYVANYFANPNQMLSALNQSDNAKEANLDYSTLADGGAVYRSGNYANGGMAQKLMIEGGHVPGKAVVKGDSLKNDIVDAKLSPGEIVIPRSIVNHPNAPEMAAQFVKETLAKGNFKNKEGYQDAGGVAATNSKDELKYILEQQNKGAFDKPEKKEPQLALSSNVMNQDYKGNYEYPQGYEQAPALMAERNVATTEPTVAAKPEPILKEEPSLFQKGYNAQKKAYLETGELAKKQAELEEAEYQKTFNELAAKQKTYQDEIADVNNEMNNLRSDIMQDKIDPRRFISNMSTGNKIGTAIGLILGGIGAGLSGGENVVLKQLNNYIEQDLYAQKAELGKKESLLSGLMQKYGNVNQAMQVSRIMMTDSLSLQMKRIASQYAGKIEAQRLLAEAGKLDQSVADQVDTFAKSRSYTSGKEVAAELDPYREQRVEVEGKPYYAGSEKLAAEKQRQIDSIENALVTLQKMQDIRADVGREKLPTPSKNKMRQLQENLKLPLYSIFIGPDYSERNVAGILDKIPDPTRLQTEVFENEVNDLKEELKQRKKEILRGIYSRPVKDLSRTKFKPTNALDTKKIEQDISEGQ